MAGKTFAAALLALVAGAMPAAAQGIAGSYLAGRTALAESDFDAAARWYGRALLRDPSNISIADRAMTAALAQGDVERAAAAARRLAEMGGTNQAAHLVLLGQMADAGEWQEILAELDAGASVGPLFDGLLRAWAQVGLGRMTEALDAFDSVSDTVGVRGFGLYHKAMALALSGDFETADRTLAEEGDDAMRLTRRGAILHAEILSQLERNDDAVAMLDRTFGPVLDAALDDLRARLEAGETVPLSIATRPQDGVADIYFSIAGALNTEASVPFVLLYTRMTEHLRPDHIDGLLMTARLLETLGRFEEAAAAYARVPRDDPAFPVAELGRAETLRRAGQVDAAIEVLQALVRAEPELPVAQVSLGDALRQVEHYDDATAAYDRAIALIASPAETHWVIWFARGITHERSDRWDDAEADFRRALELRPDQPQVLNYLGYSLVERRENLPEALAMIERAVEAEPNSGHIVDSLGWVLYRLGRHEEAVEPMERAAALLPVDPIVNDHLGDVYWVNGRKLEAQFQWRRALSFGPEEDEAGRIRRKLEVGLDAVLAEEAAAPLPVAHDG